MKAKRTAGWTLGVAAAVLMNLIPLTAGQASTGSIAGTWSAEISVDTEIFVISITFRAVDGNLEGTVSEPYGTFTDLPLAEIAFDGTVLSFHFNAPTPPDGMERTVNVKFTTVGESSMEGVLEVPDLGVFGSVRATKQ